jgi:uncharacterized protein (TIGR02594 family)
MNLPKQYAWLEFETSPRILVEFLKIYGTTEMPGPKNNPKIMAWARKVGVDKIYTADSIPWCGLGMAYVALQAGWDIPINPLWARNWLNFGTKIGMEHAMLGDVLVFERGAGGHVGIYVGQDKACFHVLGCNQSDSTNIKRIPKERCLGVRRCPWRIDQPKAVRKVWLSAAGEVSRSEA